MGATELCLAWAELLTNVASQVQRCVHQLVNNLLQMSSWRSRAKKN